MRVSQDLLFELNAANKMFLKRPEIVMIMQISWQLQPTDQNQNDILYVLIDWSCLHMHRCTNRASLPTFTSLGSVFPAPYCVFQGHLSMESIYLFCLSAVFREVTAAAAVPCKWRVCTCLSLQVQSFNYPGFKGHFCTNTEAP